MRFYIFSFFLHLLLLFIFYKAPIQERKIDSKNVVVYLTEKKNEFQAPAPAPIQSFNREPIQEKKKPEEKKIEKKEIKKEIKKIEKKVVKKKVKKGISKPVEENNSDLKEEKENISTNSAPYNPLAGLVKDGTGTYIGDQKGGQGIGYKIKREVEPQYPIMAKKANFKKEVVIKTKFLVGLNGKVEEVIFLDNFSSYGFRKEVEKALKKWEFAPIIYQGHNIKMYFYKDFRFNVK